jgi:hypothetical protein
VRKWGCDGMGGKDKKSETVPGTICNICHVASMLAITSFLHSLPLTSITMFIGFDRPKAPSATTTATSITACTKATSDAKSSTTSNRRKPFSDAAPRTTFQSRAQIKQASTIAVEAQEATSEPHELSDAFRAWLSSAVGQCVSGSARAYCNVC